MAKRKPSRKKLWNGNLTKKSRNIVDIERSTLKWDFSKLDTSGKWSLTIEVLKENWGKMNRLQGMQWGAILQDSHKNPHHSVPIEKIIPDAQKRLRKLGYKTEQLQGLLISFRLTGKNSYGRFVKEIWHMCCGMIRNMRSVHRGDRQKNKRINPSKSLA